MHKRVVSLLLTLAMLLSCLSPAWAVEETAISAEEEAVQTEIVEEVPAEEQEEAPVELPAEEETAVEGAPAEAEQTDVPGEVSQPEEEDVLERAEADEEDASFEPVEQPAEEAMTEEISAEIPAEEQTEEIIEVEEAAEEGTPAEEEQTEESVEPVDSKNGVVKVKLGDSAAENYDLLRDAIRQGSKEKKTVRIAKKGTYEVGRSGSSAIIHLLSNTDLDLNGSTLVRAGLMSNMLLVADESDSYTGTGYEMSSNITVRNGTLDGSGGAKKDCNLANIGHANNVWFYNVNFKNCRGAHLIEFTGCRDCRVEKCTFTGYTPAANANEPGEAIQLDISYNGANCDWNGLYKPDGTPCKNITITGCTFKSYPSGVGNHHAVKGLHNTGIVITNNVFKNTKSYKASNGDNANYAAIHCYAFEDSVVSGNTITGKYSSAVQISGGSVNVEGNQIGDEENYFAHPGILTNYNYAWIKGNSNKDDRKKEYVTGGSVTGNVIYTSCSSPAVTLYNKTKLDAVNENTIISEEGHAVYISKSTVSSLNKNTLKGLGGSGVYVTGGTLSNIKSNTIKSSKDYGVYLTSSSKATSKINGNKITSCGKSGIYATSNSKVKTVQSNKVKSCQEYGIGVLNKEIKVTVTENTFSKNKKNLHIKASGTIQES